MIIKHPGKRSLKSYCNLPLVNSGNYYLDRLTADVYKENITNDIMYFFSHCFTSSKNSTKIYVMMDILRNVHVKYGCHHSRT